MRRTAPVFLLLALVAGLLVGCGARPLMRLRVTEVGGITVERAGVGFVEGVLRVEMDNRNAEQVIFDAGQFELRADGRTVGTMKLLRSFVAAPGVSRVEIPFRFRFRMASMLELGPKVLSLARDKNAARQPDLRVAGTLQIVAGRPFRERTVRFSRRVDGGQMIRAFGQMPMDFLLKD